MPSVFGSDGPAVRSKDNRLVSGQFVGQARHSRSGQSRDEVRVELAGDVALQDAHDLACGCVLRRVRRATYLRVRSSLLMRVNTIRHSAWFAWRFPPGLSRCRSVLPDDAGRGATPHRCANAASLLQPVRVVAGGDQQDRGGVDADAVDLEQARRGAAHQRVECIGRGVRRRLRARARGVPASRSRASSRT